ncbi:RNA polymerase sigma-70 factor, ECF subfamily [Aristaeella lactis]|uniref:RNA polymerase sigma-70 factor, ECF subfamily n=2 Tax=Aristaeella lactis TaxID=3046383 RepID=A0AC61PJ43_9FIRM|nr:RNA polymerase sigma-70 factor, ECF subfamily [Aristaeella lactis]
MTTPDWEKIYETYSGKVMGYIAARVQRRADAEDLCADVFEKAYKKIDAYDEKKASMSTWIFTITRNTVIDYFRRNKVMDEPDENIAAEGEIDDELLSQETLSELAAALNKLPEELQDIIVLAYYDGKPLTEIAMMMRLSYGAVKIRHQKALALLKKEMTIL